MNQEPIYYYQSIDDYIYSVYQSIFVYSLLYALDVENYVQKSEVKEVLEHNSDNFLEYFHNYLIAHQHFLIFDDKIKDNIYFLINDIASKNKSLNRNEKVEIINSVKCILNNVGCDNLDFIRNQILYRDLGCLHYKRNVRKLGLLSSDSLTNLKDEYYQSLNEDYLMMRLLLKDNDAFYNGEYKRALCCKNFYRSMNTFMSIYEIMFLANSEYLKRVKFIMNSDLSYLNNLNDESELIELNGKRLDDVDDQFFDILKVTNKLVKKFERKIR